MSGRAQFGHRTVHLQLPFNAVCANRKIVTYEES
jgi:hypothetical protein